MSIRTAYDEHWMTVIRFGPFTLDAQSGELRRDGEVVPLAPQPFRLLYTLASRPGELVTREELQRQVWGDETFVDFDRGLNFCVLQARTALGDDAKQPAFIETLPRRGYRFVAPIMEPPSLPALPRSRSRLPWLLGVAAALVVVVVVAALQRSAEPASGKTMIAVLPFEELSGSDGAFFADGMTEELITHLGALQPRRLGVIARTSILRYRGTKKSIQDIGRELGVGYVVEGSVRREGDRLRVTAQLIDARDQTHLWAESFDRRGAGALAIQRDVAERIAHALKIELLADDTLSAKNPAAHELYLRGRHLYSGGSTPEVQESVRVLREAVRLEPTFVLAHIALAESLHSLAMRERLDPRVAGEEIRIAGENALQLAPGLAQSHAIAAMHRFWYAWDWDAAEESYRKAIRLNPNEPGALHDHGWLLITRGRFDEGIAQIRRAQELDPVSPRANMHVAWAYIYTGRYAEAVRESRRALALSPGYKEAYRCLGEAYQLSGNEESAREAWRLHGVKDLVIDPDRDPYGAAVAYLRLNYADRAIALLAKARDTRSGSFPLAGVDPKLAALHGDARFVRLLESVGLEAVRPPTR
jgi:TolB-like protein/DNA-binding winged helix-turn-helix (wHTH) protein